MRRGGVLVLTRKLEEVVVIDGRIRVKVASIRGSRVRLAIEAPKEMSIQRQEILEEGANDE